MPATSADRENQWMSRARRLQWRVNTNWWLERFWPLAFVWTIAAACLFLGLRRAGVETDPVWIIYLGGLVIAGIGAGWWARHHFIDTKQALVRLEEVHGLHNRLSAASAGVGPWPDFPAQVRDGWNQRWSRVTGPGLLAFVLLAAALIIPVPPVEAKARAKPQEPVAWTQVESWVDTLKEQEALAPEGLAPFEERLEALRNRPTEEWYSHGSLEAGENLREQAAQAIQALQRELADANAALGGMTGDAASNPGGIQELGAQLEASTEALGNGNLPLSGALLEQMRQLDPSMLNTMDRDKLDKLREQLEKTQQACSACQGGGLSQDALNAQRSVRDGNGPGRGEIKRGPGHVPFGIMDNASEGAAAQLETLSNDDPERAALGDALGTTAEGHYVDREARPDGSQAGEATTGSGGEAVWRQSLTPGESDVLERFFK